MAVNPGGDRSDDGRASRARSTTTRRSVCRGIAVTALPITAGCSSLSEVLGGAPGDVTVFNDTDSAVSATVAVTELPNETTALSETTDIGPSQASKFDDVFESPTRYRFDVETADGRSDNYEWDLPSVEHYLYVTIRPSAIEFEENDP